MNVIIYTRVSTDEQKDGCSLEVQEKYVRAYCANHSYNVIDVYYEDYSAKDHDMRRPEMKKIYDYCKKNRRQVDKVLFLRWDRYARNVEFAFSYKRKFYDELKIEINAIESPIDFTSTEWSLMLSMYCGTAQTEDDKISKRTLDGIHGTLLQGKCANKAPRGYKNVRHSKHDCEVIIDEERGPVIKTVFEEVAKGQESASKIRRRMCPNIPESSFFDMLKNPFYMGKIRVPAYGNDPEQIVEGQHQPLIDEMIFQKVQEIVFGKNKKKQPMSTGKKLTHPDLYLRSGLVCPCCGHAMTGAISRGNGGEYAYYFCSNEHKHCNFNAIQANDEFVRYVSGLIPNDVVLELYHEILKDIRHTNNASREKEIDKLKAEISQLQARINNAEDKYLDGAVSNEMYSRMVERYQNDIATKKSQIENIQTLIRGNIEPKLKYSIDLISNLKGLFQDGHTDTKIKLLGSMFPKKLEFDGKTYRTNDYNEVLNLIYQETNILRGRKDNKKGEESSLPQFSTQSRGRTGTGCPTGV